MQTNNPGQPAPINFKAIIAGMVLMFIIVQVGFHATYIRRFPEFTGFYWVHHIHGALMAGWVILLVLQPVLIYKKRYSLHRFFGKLSYIIAPLVIVSMFLIARQNYLKGMLTKPVADVMATQSITWMQLFMFVLFYSLAIRFRKNTYWHMRFMIGTALVMIGPPLNRILYSYFPEIGLANILLIVLYIKVTLAAAFFLNDIAKKKDWKPYLIVLLTFLFASLVYHARYSDAWQAFGKLVVNNLYR